MPCHWSYLWMTDSCHSQWQTGIPFSCIHPRVITNPTPEIKGRSNPSPQAKLLSKMPWRGCCREVPLWCSGLRIWRCHCSGTSSIPGPGSFHKLQVQPKKKKERKKERKKENQKPKRTLQKGEDMIAWFIPDFLIAFSREFPHTTLTELQGKISEGENIKKESVPFMGSNEGISILCDHLFMCFFWNCNRRRGQTFY